MDIKRLDDGSGIENTLRLNNAKYHNTCRLMFNNSKFFMHENQTTPPSLSQNGCLNIGTKSDLMTVLETDINLPGAEPKADAFIIDGAALIKELQEL